MIRKSFSTGVFAACLLALGSFCAQAEPPSESDYAKVNAALADGVLQPVYGALVRETQQLAKASHDLCAAPPPRDLLGVKGAYHGAMDAWMTLEPVKIGPIEAESRAFRVYFWPDKRGRGARQLAAILRAKDEKQLTPQAMEEASVAIQGLPAVEWLLFGHTGAASLTKGGDGDYACRFLGAVTDNLARVAAGAIAAWPDFRREIDRAGKGGDAVYESQQHVTLLLIKGMYVTAKTMIEVKLDPVLGANIDRARPKRAESVLAKRAARNLEQNLTTLQKLVDGAGGPGLGQLMASDPIGAGKLSEAFPKALSAVRDIKMPLSEAAGDRQGRPAVVRLARHLETLEHLIIDRLAPAAGVDLGFNAMDGD